MSAVLSIDGAAKRFGATTALDGAAFALQRGEWLALLGPNGAGKTTLVRAVAGRARLDAGSIDLLGERLDGGAGAARAKLGVVPQDLALYAPLTARENLEAFGALHGLSRADARTRSAWALEWTGLTERADERVKGFSGGMKRRLNLACGVLHRPEVILLDEPTVGVDPQSRQRIWEMLESLREDGASLVLTTHQLDEAQTVADRIVIIDHGRVIADGTFDDLLDSTIGAGRRIVIRLDAAPSDALLAAGFEAAGDRAIARTLTDVGAELPAALTAVARAGRAIEDLTLEAPSLQAVFIHLTGRELRE